MNKSIVFLCIFILILISFPPSSVTAMKGRIRIVDVDFDEEIIKVNETFNINVSITKQRFLQFRGQVHIYLTCTGLMREKIGQNLSVIIPMIKNESHLVEVNCNISDVEADWFNENYGLKIVLYSKIGNFLIKKDSYSIESIRIVSKFYEKNKLRISDFKPPDLWPKNNNNGGMWIESVDDEGKINVTLSNNALYDYDVVVIVYLVEKTSIGIPFIEGFGEYVKEIGNTTIHISAGEQNKKCVINCTLRSADQDKINRIRKFDVQAVLFANVDGELIEVDTSSIQTIKVQFDGWKEKIVMYGPWIWLVFIAGIGTFILLIVTVKLIIPFTKIKGNEVQDAVDEIRRRKRRKK